MPGCSCDDYEGVTKADIDRFTDRIENVLNDEQGRRLFRNFMYTCKMRDGRRTLDFWEHVEKLLSCKEHKEREIDRLIDEAERIEELDFAIMERLQQVHDSGNKEELVDVLKVLKVEATRALKNEYNAFRRHFIYLKK